MEGESVPAKVLAKYGIGLSDIQQDLSGAKSSDDHLAAAEAVARMMNHDVVGTEHLLLAIIEDWNTFGARLLIRKGVSPREVSKVIQGLWVGNKVAPAEGAALHPWLTASPLASQPASQAAWPASPAVAGACRGPSRRLGVTARKCDSHPIEMLNFQK